MKKGLISIIVPVYKVEEYLDRCVESLVNQTYTNLEIILVDDGSPDNSGKLCDEWALKDKRIKVIHKENSGVSSARNIGIDNAKGEYIGFVDSDDYVSSKMYEFLINSYDKDTDYVCCDFTRDGTFDENNIIDSNCNIYELIKYIYPWHGGVWTGLYKKEILNQLRFDKDYYFGEDLIFLISYLIKCNYIKRINNKLYYYYENINSVTKQKEYNKLMTNEYNYYLSIKKSYKILENKFNDKYIGNYINYMLSVFKIFKFNNNFKYFKKEVIIELEKYESYFTNSQKMLFIFIKYKFPVRFINRIYNLIKGVVNNEESCNNYIKWLL